MRDIAAWIFLPCCRFYAQLSAEHKTEVFMDVEYLRNVELRSVYEQTGSGLTIVEIATGPALVEVPLPFVLKFTLFCAAQYISNFFTPRGHQFAKFAISS